ncbi:MAG TPA: dTMP kinase [Acidimicrobiia bacterium]|jgi:dTMP kinase
MPGRFVVLEGGDASGKSTQAARLAARLRERGVAVCETFEPGATAAGAVLREVLLHGREPVNATAEMLLMAADRAQHVDEQIAPALERGDWVVCDRYVPSSLVYQGVVRGIGVDAVDAVNRVATAGLSPDLVVVLDVDNAVAVTRSGGSRDRLESEGEPFHSAVRAAYRSLAAERGWRIVDGTPDADTVADGVWTVVAELLERA